MKYGFSGLASRQPKSSATVSSRLVHWFRAPINQNYLKLNCHTQSSPLYCGKSPSALENVRPSWMSFSMSTLHLENVKSASQGFLRQSCDSTVADMFNTGVVRFRTSMSGSGTLRFCSFLQAVRRCPETPCLQKALCRPQTKHLERFSASATGKVDGWKLTHGQVREIIHNVPY